MKSLMPGVLLRYASRLRFPTLFMLAFTLFFFDVLIPDVVPFVDEILLGLASLLFGSWRARRDPDEAP